MSSSDNSGLIYNALEKTQPDLFMSMDVEGSFKTWIKNQGAKVSLYRDYERGDHRASMTAQMRKMLRLPEDDSGLNDFNDNYMQIVIDKMAGRLHCSEISLGVPAKDKSWLSPILQYNNWDALQGTAYRGSIRDGDSYIMVDPEWLTWTSEPAFDGYSGLFALFESNSNTPYWACKIWSEGSIDEKETMRLVVYEPERISYWRGEENGQEIREDNVVSSATVRSYEKVHEMINARPWPVSMIPIIHIVNKYDNYSDSGESELRPAIPLQDVLNRTIHSMVMASEFAAFNVLWSIGMSMDPTGIVPGAVISLTLKDAEGKAIIEPTPEMLQFLQAVRVGQFTGTDIGQYTNQIDKIVREISQCTQTPIYGITAQGAISGEALKQLEIGLIGKCERFQRQNTDAIRDLVRVTAEIQRTFSTEYQGDEPPTDTESITVGWKSPEILDVSTQITMFFNMRRDAPGLWDDTFYHKKIGGLLGMSQTDIKDESEKAINSLSDQMNRLTGAGTGEVPVV